MIDIKTLTEFVESRLANSDYFLVDINVSKENEIKIEIDSMQSVDIDFCIKLSKEIEEVFPREPEDYELEVGSAGITAPFKVKKQFLKNIGKEVEILPKVGKKTTGLLVKASEDTFTVRTTVKFKPEGKKKPEQREKEIELKYSDVNSVKYLLKF